MNSKNSFPFGKVKASVRWPFLVFSFLSVTRLVKQNKASKGRNKEWYI